jgi:hypothetical protein
MVRTLEALVLRFTIRYYTIDAIYRRWESQSQNLVGQRGGWGVNPPGLWVKDSALQKLEPIPRSETTDSNRVRPPYTMALAITWSWSSLVETVAKVVWRNIEG